VTNLVNSFVVAVFLVGASVLTGCGVESMPVDQPPVQEEVSDPERNAMADCVTNADCAGANTLCCWSNSGPSPRQCFGWGTVCTQDSDCPSGYLCAESKGRCWSTIYAVCAD
jgi:hypothetical protein